MLDVKGVELRCDLHVNFPLDLQYRIHVVHVLLTKPTMQACNYSFMDLYIFPMICMPVGPQCIIKKGNPYSKAHCSKVN